MSDADKEVVETLIQSYLEELSDRLVAKASYCFNHGEAAAGSMLISIATSIDDMFDDDETEH